jgi:hypothetical protein
LLVVQTTQDLVSMRVKHPRHLPSPCQKNLALAPRSLNQYCSGPSVLKFPAPCCRLDLVSNQEDVGFIFRQSQHSIQKLQPMRRFRPRSANMHLRPDTGLLIAIPANDANTDNESDGVERAYVRAPRWINRRRPSVERARSFREPEPMNSPLRRSECGGSGFLDSGIS